MWVGGTGVWSAVRWRRRASSGGGGVVAVVAIGTYTALSRADCAMASAHYGHCPLG